MSADKAGEIIRRAMADRSVYDAMAVRENEVWGKILRDREQSEPATEDIKAGTALGICRNQSSLFRVANNLSKAGWSWGCVSAIDSNGRTIFVADAHRGDGKRFVVRADERLTAFIEIGSAVCSCGEPP
jgi:hypothetical protein